MLATPPVKSPSVPENSCQTRITELKMADHEWIWERQKNIREDRKEEEIDERAKEERLSRKTANIPVIPPTWREGTST